MNKKIVLVTMGIVVTIGITGGIMIVKQATTQTPIQVTVHNDRLSTYQTLTDINNDAELVVQGKVMSTDPAQEIRIAVDQNNRIIKELPGNLYTDAHVLVTEVWKGNSQLAKNEIIVRQLGGQNKQFVQTSDDDVLLGKNENVILFLERSRVREGLSEGDGWTVLGAGAGHGTLRDGKISFTVADPFTKEFTSNNSAPFENILHQFYRQ